MLPVPGLCIKLDAASTSERDWVRLERSLLCGTQVLKRSAVMQAVDLLHSSLHSKFSATMFLPKNLWRRCLEEPMIMI